MFRRTYMQAALSYLPNLVTGIRLLVTAPTVWALLTDRTQTAMALLIVAGLTDWLDGWLARRYVGWSTELGAFLDPMADKVFLVSTFLSFGYLRYVPRWLVIVAVGRDIIIVLGILLYRVWIGPLYYKAILSSKINTVLQIVFILLVLIQVHTLNIPPAILRTVSMSMVITSAVSLIQYAELWIVRVSKHVKGT